MIRKSKFWYCTLFWPKYCAASGAAPNSASATATPPMRRMNLILSTGPPGPSRPESRHRAPVRRSRGAPAGRTRAIRDERRVRRSPRSPAAPSGPGPALRRDGERCRGAPTPSSSAPPSRARARPKCPIRSQSSRPRTCAGWRIDRLPVRQRLGHEPQGRERVSAGPHRRASAPPASHSAPPTRLFRVPSTDMAMIGLTWLLLDDRHANLGMHVGMQLDPDPELAQLADRLREVHLALVHVDAELFQLALDVARRDRAVQLVLLAHLHREAELHLGDPGRLGLGGALLRGSLFGDALRLVGDLLLVGLRGRVGEPLGEEVVPGVAVLHFDDLPRLP